MPYPTKKLREKQWRQQQGSFAEFDFEKFCKENGISCVLLEKDQEAREKVLKDSKSKCPDFLCVKNGCQIFVEVKTHTLFTNEARNRMMSKIVQTKKAAGLSGTTIFDSFDPRPELKVPFEGYLRDTSKKFKNIKGEFNFPRILLLKSSFVENRDFPAIFWGAYPSFRMDGTYAGLSKTHRGLFDSTGSNVSAVVYWNRDLKRYEGVANLKAQIPLLDGDFKIFFETANV